MTILSRDKKALSNSTKHQKNHKELLFDLLAIVMLAAFTLVFFWPVVSSTGWIPRGGGDSVSFIFPMYRFAAQSFAEGTIPLWNPYQYAGHPFIADNQSGIFYPINLLLFLINPNFNYAAIEWLVILHVFLAGVFMYFCLRGLQPEQSLARPAAVAGGLAFMFSGVFISHIGNLNLIAVAAWLPLIFLCLHRAIGAKNRVDGLAWAIGGGTALGVSTLAGHGQMTFLLGTFLGGYAIYRTMADRNGRSLLYLLLLAIIGIGIAAMSLFPALQAVSHTVRAEFDAARALNYALPWRALNGLLAPDFFGRGKVDFWGNWSRVEVGYVGVLTLFLAGVALLTRRNRLTWFFMIAAIVALLLAAGPNTPIYPFLLRALPFFPFQVPARFVLLLDFCLAALAAYGFDALLKRPPPLRGFLWGSGLAAVLLVGMLLWQYSQLVTAVPQHEQQMLRALGVFAAFAAGSWFLILARSKSWLAPALFAALAIIWLALDLIGLGRNVEVDWNDPTPGFAAESPALEYLKNDPGIHRIDIATGAWQPNLPQLEKLYSIRGVYNPLELANYAVTIGSVGFRGSTPYNLLGAKYVIGGKNEPPGDTNFLVPVFEADPDVTVYLNTLALPRAAVLFNAEVVGDHDTAFDRTHAADFDPQTLLILEEGAPLVQAPGQSNITILKYDPNAAAFEVTTDKPAYFLLTDIYHPDWKTAVDGVETPILVGNYAFRAVLLDPGAHIIEMWYEPTGWRLGLFVSGMTWLFVIGFFIWYGWQKRKTH